MEIGLGADETGYILRLLLLVISWNDRDDNIIYKMDDSLKSNESANACVIDESDEQYCCDGINHISNDSIKSVESKQKSRWNQNMENCEIFIGCY